MKIRAEKQEEFDEIYKLVELAFKTAKVSDGDEQDFVLELRKREGYLPDLALIAQDNDELIGHIMFTQIAVELGDKEIKALLLAPLTVKLEYRNSGIGGALIQEGFNKAKNLGYEAVFIVGDPNYYNRFGFIETKHYNIFNTNQLPDQYVMVYELSKGILSHVKGTINIH